MSIRVGEVIAVRGLTISIKVDEQSNRETLFYNGEKFKGVSIREYLAIQRGFRSIVCVVEGEYLDESRIDSQDGKIAYLRKVEVRPIGYFESGVFKEGIKFMPMIKDEATLLQEEKIASIFGKNTAEGFFVGKMLKEDIPISIPWQKLFNSHIGIFGNTGSGKSNTLTKLYTVLFDQKANEMVGKSQFVILDFNGEYTGEQITDPLHKKVIKLSTSGTSHDKFALSQDEFWSLETLCMLFQATQNTQRPFLNRVIEGKKKYEKNSNSTVNYLKRTFELAFTAAEPKPEALDLLRNISRKLNHEQLLERLNEVSWHSKHTSFTISARGMFFNADGQTYRNELSELVDSLNIDSLDSFNELVLRCDLQLTRDLLLGYVQFDHIQPLLKRIDSSLVNLAKVTEISKTTSEGKPLTIISLKRCNSDMKKVLPLLIAKHFYEKQKSVVEHPVNKTVHLIIDEAHNVLSQSSTREHESWKDYRLETFEEIIKEGRKFGVFITVSSQRPADISPTIVSQLHNFFIHRLVNDRDLYLIDNTISTLDALSRGLIPTLARGCCVVTGTSFDIPMVLQIDELSRAKQPDSEDVDLESLWS
jgi:uncharacterized protein